MATPTGPQGLDAYLKGEYPLEIEEAKRMAVQALKNLWAAVRSRGSKPALIVVPAVFEIYPGDMSLYVERYGLSGELDRDKPTRLLMKTCDEEGWECLDLSPGFARAARTGAGRLYFDWDPHWNSAGHRVAAQRIHEWLQDKGLVPRCE